MTLKQIAGLGKKLIAFLGRFGDCFGRSEPRETLKTFVEGQLSDLKRKTAEGIALKAGEPPRTLQRFLESVKWDDGKLRDQCQQLVAAEHWHPEAIGIVDESGIRKSGDDTVGVGRQWCGTVGKIENCTVAVHLGYAFPGFQCLLDSRVYLPEDWANDAERRKECHVPAEVEFRTKPEIAVELIDCALTNEICVTAWTADELYGRNLGFLDALQARRQVFVVEVPCDFHGWLQKPRILRKAPTTGPGKRKKYPRLVRRFRPCEVRNLVRYSPDFKDQAWQRYRIKDTDKGPEVWEVKWAVFWRKDGKGMPSRRHCLIVARNVLTAEVKYFLSNRVPGEAGVTLRWLLRVAFGRWSVERCFRVAKQELGMDDFQVRGWDAVHRHYYLTQLSYLFCARTRLELDPPENLAVTEEPGTRRLTMEQVRGAVNAWLEAVSMTPHKRRERYEDERKHIEYHQRRNEHSRVHNTWARRQALAELGIDPDRIKSCIPSGP
jgi:SRSO17 transposase